MAKEHLTWNRVKIAKSAVRRLNRSNEGTDSKTALQAPQFIHALRVLPTDRFPMDH